MKKALVLTVIIPLLVLLISGRTIAGEAGKPAPITGKVVETMDSGGYTYVCVEKGGKKTWVAMPQMKIEKGKEETPHQKGQTWDRRFLLAASRWVRQPFGTQWVLLSPTGSQSDHS